MNTSESSAYLNLCRSQLLKRQRFSDRTESGQRFAGAGLQEQVTVGIKAGDQNFKRVLFRVDHKPVGL